MNTADILPLTSGLLAYGFLAVILIGAWSATRRRAGRMLGPKGRWLGIPWFYLVSTAVFLGLCNFGWLDLPLRRTEPVETWTTRAGSLLYFPGMLLAFWARLTLGRNYAASTALAVRLFEDHRLVITGPYALVRHPMYLGLMLAAAGGVLIFWTWTTVGLAAFASMLVMRARMEERILAIEFREEWYAYCQRVPMLFPRLLPGRGFSRPQEQL